MNILDHWLKVAPDATAIAPITILLILACIVALVDLFVDDPRKLLTYRLTQLSLAIVAGLNLWYLSLIHI